MTCLFETQCFDVNVDRCSDEISTGPRQQCGVRIGNHTRICGTHSPDGGFDPCSHGRQSKTASFGTVAYVFRCKLSAFLLQVTYEPTTRGSRRTVGPINTPSWPSKFASVWLTTDCARFKRRPAAEKLPSSVAAMRVRIWSNVTPSSMLSAMRLPVDSPGLPWARSDSCRPVPGIVVRYRHGAAPPP